MTLTTRLASSLRARSGRYQALVCTDVYSQISRFTPQGNCWSGAKLTIATSRSFPASGPAPNTIIRTGVASLSNRSTAVIRFVSTIGAGTFECSLDAAPWLPCKSPQRYIALVDGPHAFAVRAISASGAPDLTPARISWTVPPVAPAVTVRNPINGSTTHERKPGFSGGAGTALGDSSKITVEVFSGSGVSGSPVQTLATTASGGSWAVAPIKLLANGTYTVRAQQSNSAGTTGMSTPSTFAIAYAPSAPSSDPAPSAPSADPPPGGSTSPPAPSTFSVGGSVSGLSGTVVLQDNGGDDLSVGSNGPFTFATPVVDGGAYNVTVKSSPSGQTCTTSGASGTVTSANVTSVAVTCASQTTSQPGADDFNRPDGGLGAGWAAIGDGGLSIASQAVLGTANAQAGDTRIAESYGSDQFSQIEVTSTQLTGGEWIGPAVRSQNGGQDTYLGIYFWNNGNPQLRLYKRTAGTWIQLGNSYNSGPLPAGTKLTLTAVGSTILFQQDGTTRIVATDTTLTGGAPGLMTFGAATTDNWTGGTPKTFSVGGSVSGLSGTVVLQDNGGDDLSVGSDGPFTFATPVVDGGAYNVTVKSSPSGQTCTTSGASGTVTSANVTSVAVTCASQTTSQPGADDFNRPDGGLGAGWAAIGDGGLSIASQAVLGTANAQAGDTRIAESYGSDQFSQIEVTSTQLTGGEWIGPAVRSQNGGQDTYLGIYFWNNGNPQLRLYKRTAGTWIQLGNSYNSGPLPAGTKLTLTAVGSTILFQQDGTTRIVATDTTLTGGAPGLMTFGAATTDNWTGGTPKTFSVGGSVSGLSGTVVLQDNGGDDLSVGSDGPFTFATPVVDGGAYNVTVKSSPSGQTCTTSGASGTVTSANVTSVAVTCASQTTSQPGADDFNRPDGGLGAGWAAIGDGGLSIASQAVLGTANAQAGDTRIAESYGSDQFSQIEVTSTQLTGGEWIGPAVRSQNGGQDTYLGIYFWNNGNQQLRLYKRTAGTFIQLGNSYNSGPLPAGTKLTLTAVGSTISLPAGRHHTNRRDRHHPHRRRPRPDDLRRRHSRQLDRRHTNRRTAAPASAVPVRQHRRQRRRLVRHQLARRRIWHAHPQGP